MPAMKNDSPAVPAMGRSCEMVGARILMFRGHRPLLPGMAGPYSDRACIGRGHGPLLRKATGHV